MTFLKEQHIEAGFRRTTTEALEYRGAAGKRLERVTEVACVATWENVSKTIGIYVSDEESGCMVSLLASLVSPSLAESEPYRSLG